MGHSPGNSALLRLLISLCLGALAAAPAGCGGDDGAECSLDAEFDCNRVCQRLEEFCNTCDEPPDEGCEDPACVEDCENAKADPDAIPEEFQPLVLGQLNCLDDNDSCSGFTDCLTDCLAD